MIKRISVFDFDSTLCRSPEKTPENKKIWDEKNPGKPFGPGWWGNVNSLCPITFDIPLIEHVKADLLDRIEAIDTYTVLLTGRITRFQKVVKEILRGHGVPYIDAYYFNDRDNTLKFKLEKLQQLKEEFPEATHFEMWEDRVEHIPYFQEWGKEAYGDNFTLYIIE